MKVLVFKDGSTRELTGEAGKYWLVGTDRVRKLNPDISEIREVPDPVEIKLAASSPAECECEVKAAPAKKKAAAKKKKAAEAKEDGERGE